MRPSLHGLTVRPIAGHRRSNFRLANVHWLLQRSTAPNSARCRPRRGTMSSSLSVRPLRTAAGDARRRSSLPSGLALAAVLAMKAAQAKVEGDTRTLMCASFVEPSVRPSADPGWRLQGRPAHPPRPHCCLPAIPQDRRRDTLLDLRGIHRSSTVFSRPLAGPSQLIKRMHRSSP
jgi:hypothetical protein